MTKNFNKFALIVFHGFFYLGRIHFIYIIDYHKFINNIGFNLLVTSDL
jgi:hypothetical protein